MQIARVESGGRLVSVTILAKNAVDYGHSPETPQKKNGYRKKIILPLG
jgi:hypothetical protein